MCTLGRIAGVTGVLVCLLGIATAGWVACNRESNETSTVKGDSAARINAHGLHKVHNARLREIMHRLSAMDFGQMSVEIEATGRLRRDMSEVGEMAAALAADADVIPLIFQDPEMNAESLRVLNSLSSQLRRQAEELCDDAEKRDVKRVKEKLDEMLMTCQACHDSFRVPSLAINLTRGWQSNSGGSGSPATWNRGS